ncbi:NAD(P)-binding protein [Penicillium malachiteum]|uniref:NAD(P)-binding protein n=1 Tax=Penicillium malachiteum TaxID=1324776 RepID=UPI0025498EBB|nr:NAD(P)-binding protein [Penicillium malachiteum]KAJ5713997.1 NAD(P)-binding protein [Penicillium malachiteum]
MLGISFEFIRFAHAKRAKILIADLQLGLIAISVSIWNDVPDIYIAGAGVFEPKWSSFWQDPENETYDSIAINVNHPIKLTRIAIQALLSRDKRGVVCIIGSIAGLAGNYAVPLYCASKHAVTGFVRSMVPCEELEGVKITAICPCLVRTPLWTDQSERMEQFSIDDAETVTAAQVGKAMITLVEDGQYKGGTVLEITAFGTRVIPEWNISPPPTKFTGIVSQTAIDRNLAPIRARLKKERRALL